MKTKILLAIVLADFLALTAWAMYQVGVPGLIEAVTSGPATILLTVDLTIALALTAAWMWSDARGRGANALPYLVLTLFTGAAGPLLYLVRRRA